MPVRILQDNGTTALVEYPDGRQTEMPIDLAVEEVHRSYEDPGGQGPVPNTAYTADTPGEITFTPQQVAPASPEEITFAPEESVLPPPPQEAEYTADPVYVGSQPQVEGRYPLAGDQAQNTPESIAFQPATPVLPQPGAPIPLGQVTPHGAFGAPRSGGRTHTGVDYAAKEGDPVLAYLPGQVTRVGPTVGDGGRGGNRVQIDHGNGLTTSVMHMGEFSVKEGDQVPAGATIGTAGSTGVASGPHEHRVFEVDGRRVPREVFNRVAQERGALSSSSSANTSFSYSGQTGETPAITDPAQLPTRLPGPQDQTGYLSGVAQAQGIRAGAAELYLEAEQGKLRVAQQLAAQQAQEQERAVLAHQAAQQQAQGTRQQYEAQIQEAVSRVASVDPGRAWRNAGSFGSAMGILSAAVGGWLQVTRGGPNHAMQAIQQTIDNDIQAQQTDIATQREGVYRAERAYERNEANVADRFRRIEEERMLRLGGLIESAKRESLLYESPIAQAKYAETIAALQLEFMNAYKAAGDQVYKQTFDKVWSESQMVAAAERLRQGREEISIAQGRAASERAAAQGQFGGLTFVNDPNTGRSWAVDPKIAQTMDKGEYGKIRDSLPRDASALAATKRYVARMNEIGRVYGGWGKTSRFSPTAEELAELRQLREKAVNAVRHATTGANLTNFELEIWQAILPEPTTKTSQSAIDDAARFVELHGQEAQRKYSHTFGLRDVDPKTGALVPVDLTKEWGTVGVGEKEPQDAASLNTRLNESVEAINSLSTGWQSSGAAPREASSVEKSQGVTGVAPQAPAKPPKLNETVAAVMADARTLKQRIVERPEESGATWDLAVKTVQDLIKGAAVLEANGHPTEAGEMLEIAADLNANLRKVARRSTADNQFEDLQKDAAELPQRQIENFWNFVGQ